MKKSFLLLLLVLISSIGAFAQQFISINPNLGPKGQTISTTVTSSGFGFTTGSAPSWYGDFYMSQQSTVIHPSSITVIDDDHLTVVWPIPANAPVGRYKVEWDLVFCCQFFVPGGFNVDCVAPDAQITGGSYFYLCPGSTITLQANTGTGFLYQWYLNGVLINGATSSAYIASAGGTYTVRVSNASGCPNFSDPVSVYTAPVPPASITSPGTNTSICPGSSIVLTGNSVASSTYKWYKNGVQISGAISTQYTTSDTGTYTYRVTNYYGCSTLSAPRTISYKTLPQAQLNPQGPTTFCAGNSVNLVSTSGTGLTYQWYKYGNAIAGAVNQTLNVTSTGTYKVQVTSSNGCTKKSGSVSVTSNPLPSAIITPQGPTTFCAGGSVQLNANTGTGLTYKWKKYSNIISGATNPNYTATVAGKYKVIVTNSNGCSRASAPVNVSVPCREAGSMITSETESLVYPNPAQNMLYIGSSEYTRIEIINIEGKSVITRNYYSVDGIDISTLPQGIYLAIIYTKDEILKQRFVKDQGN